MEGFNEYLILLKKSRNLNYGMKIAFQMHSMNAHVRKGKALHFYKVRFCTTVSTSDMMVVLLWSWKLHSSTWKLGKKDITSIYHISFYVCCCVLLLKRLTRDSNIRQHASSWEGTFTQAPGKISQVPLDCESKANTRKAQCFDPLQTVSSHGWWTCDDPYSSFVSPDIPPSDALRTSPLRLK